MNGTPLDRITRLPSRRRHRRSMGGDVNTWRIETMRGGSGTITHPVIAVAPGCPTERHPTRDCGCKVFRSRALAEAYIAEREAA